jgi:cyclopropane fatty-acyl-phospholipid synthase-like methyltransferase
MDWPRNHISVDVSADVLGHMHERMVEKAGRAEPDLPAAAENVGGEAAPGTRDGDCLASGGTGAANLALAAQRAGLDLGRYRSCFELGCGESRLTISLARQFAHVTAADLSAARLVITRGTLDRAGVGNVSLLRLDTIAAYRDLPQFDVLFSMRTLQKAPPPLMAHMLAGILARMNPGGLGYFQMLTYVLDYRFDAETHVEERAPNCAADHCLPQDAVFEIVDRANCRLLEIREEAFADAHAISNWLLVQKNDG